MAVEELPPAGGGEQYTLGLRIDVQDHRDGGQQGEHAGQGVQDQKGGQRFPKGEAHVDCKIVRSVAD